MLSAESRVYWKAVLLQVIQEALAIFNEASDIGKDYHHWVLDQTLIAIIRDLISKVMYLKGVKVCLRPRTMASPEPQLSTHTAPLRIQIHGAVKHWTMEELQDLSTRSKRQIEQPVSIEAWQVTLFGKELGEGGARTDSVAKSAPRTRNPMTPSPATPALPSQPSRASAPSTPFPAVFSDEEDEPPSVPQPAREQVPVEEHQHDPRSPAEDAADEQDQPYADEAIEQFKPGNIVATKPLHDFKKVSQRLPQLAKEKPQTAARLLLGLHEKY